MRNTQLASPNTCSLPAIAETIDKVGLQNFAPADQATLSILRNGKPSMSRAMKADIRGREIFHKAISQALTSLDQALNNARPLTPDIVDTIADDIIDEWGRFLQLAEIPHIVRLARRGHFGTAFYGGLSEPAIMEMIATYIDERSTLLEQLHDKEDALRASASPSHELAIAVDEVPQEDGSTLRVGRYVMQLTEQAKRRQEEWATVAKVAHTINDEAAPTPQPTAPRYLSDEELQAKARKARQEIAAIYGDNEL